MKDQVIFYTKAEINKYHFLWMKDEDLVLSVRE